MKNISLISLSVLTCAITSVVKAEEAKKPNIIYILADDLGYGDVQVLNPDNGKIATPHMDKLAKQGMTFTDMHTTSSVCTPTRYGILTGRYNWRSRLQRSVLFGFDQPLIDNKITTVPKLLKKQGYNTAMIGKWHLGLGMVTKDGKPSSKKKTNVDWKARISGGPVDLGFDSWFGISASLDMPPFIWIENDRFIGECTTEKKFYRKGPAHEDFEAIDVLPEFGRRSAEFIANYKEDKPFFLYVPLTSPHTPILPTKEWQGKSGLGSYGDFVMMTDAVVGQIVDAVDASSLASNTIIIVTSDNGCSNEADFPALKAQGHLPSGIYRGSKSDIWDGGHRVPFIVRWPDLVKPGTQNDTLLCTTDLMATAAELSGGSLSDSEGVDSVSFVPALEGKEIQSTRKGVVHHSISGQFAYTQGKWKILTVKGSGGWMKEKMKDDSPYQLYDMEADPGEQNNLYKEKPEVFQKLVDQLLKDIRRGRSTDGPDQKNDVKVKFRPKGLEQK